MIRIVKLSGTYHGYDMGELSSFIDLETFLTDHISGFVDSGDPVLLVNELDDIESFTHDISIDDIKMVDPEIIQS